MSRKNEPLKKDIYNFINDYIKEYGVSPSYDELAINFHLAKSTIFKYIKRLEEEGYITKYGHNQIVTIENYGNIDKIPILGTIACGKPKLAVEDILGYLPINKELLGEGEYFALVASGDSMINISINNGDIVIVKKQESAENGDVIVAMVENSYLGLTEATLKRFYKEKDKIRLHPENDNMEDIFVNDVVILGKAVKVIKDVI